MNPEAQRLRDLLAARDRSAEPSFRRALESEDPEMRAIGARGLYILGAPDALDAALRTIDDAADLLHADITPAVLTLSDMGRRVLRPILPLLASPGERTRQHAQRVLERVTLDEVSRSVQPRALSDAARNAWRELWARNGSYRWDAPEAARRASIGLWQAWIDEIDQPDHTRRKAPWA